MTENKEPNVLPALKQFKRIPVYVVEEHNDALQYIYSAIGRNRLPLEGTTLLHLDSHPDMLIDRKLKGDEARAGRELLPLLQIENWIVPAAAAGFISRVIWLRPPWAKQFSDGSRTIKVGDHPETGFLRVDCKEPYYLSDALYSSKLLNMKEFVLTVAELSDTIDSAEVDCYIQNLINKINVTGPFVLDIDLDFFSTGNPFLSLYENIGLYDLLQPIFDFELPVDNSMETIENITELRDKQLQELEVLFQHLEIHGDLEKYEGTKTEIFQKVLDLSTVVKSEAACLGEQPNWWAVFAAGCTRDQGGLPYHISSEQQIRDHIQRGLVPLLRSLPAPVLITIARSTDDGYCPQDQVDFIQNLVLQTLQDIYDTDDPSLCYLTANTYD